MQKELDFKDLADYALRYISDLVPEWLPGGRMQGGEWCVGSIKGGPGDSMRVNMSSGKWADFATEDKGGDLISLLACINGTKQLAAAKSLSERVNYRTSDIAPYVPTKTGPAKPEDRLIKPPANLIPNLTHFKLGAPSMSWTYRDPDGAPMFWIARYERPGEGKEFFPWSYSEQQKKLIMKGWPEPRPLYNWDKIVDRPDMPILIVEGEKAVVGAEKIGAEVNYVVTTWPNGSRSWRKADWEPLRGRKILIWPDADEPGRAAASGLAELLEGMADQIKIIRPEKDDGWDAWDAYIEEKTWPEIITWAKKNVTLYLKSTTELVEPEPEPQEAEIVESEPEPEPPALKVEHTVKLEPDEAPLEEATQKELREYGVMLNGQDRPYPSINNLSRIFQHVPEFKGHFWYDEFDYRSYADMFGKAAEIGDTDIFKVTAYVQGRWGLPVVKSSLVYEALRLTASLDSRHSVRDWIGSLKWDGAKRIEQFFPDYFGADKNEYTEAVSRNFWVGMVARVFNPGCKNDYMVVLEGPQGVGKSMALAAIGGQWHAESTESFGSKDFFQGLHGKMLIEIAELDSFSRAEVTRVKQVVTAQRDRFRASYGRTASDYPRQCIFVGTTNEYGYLRDATGARRFWPIKCEKIDVPKIKADRGQLFAEAWELFKNGSTWHIVPRERAEQEQEDRYQYDEIQTRVANYVRGRAYIEMIDLARDALKTDESKFDRRIQARIAVILRRLGWECRRETVNGEQTRVWAHKDTPSFVDQGLFSRSDGVEF